LLRELDDTRNEGVLRCAIDKDVPSKITLGLSNDNLSDGGLSDGMVIKSERIDGILPQGLFMLTLGLAVGFDGNLGKGTYSTPVRSVE
jgi:hypothetical protein